jgi:hypothetical protein
MVHFPAAAPAGQTQNKHQTIFGTDETNCTKNKEVDFNGGSGTYLKSLIIISAS